MLDIVGFDSNGPEVIRRFVVGDIRALVPPATTPVASETPTVEQTAVESQTARTQTAAGTELAVIQTAVETETAETQTAAELLTMERESSSGRDSCGDTDNSCEADNCGHATGIELNGKMETKLIDMIFRALFAITITL